MALTSTEQAWVTAMTPYAIQAGAATGWSPQLVMAQWANETRYGQTFSTANNLGNIGNTTSNPKGGPSYPNIAAGVQGWINFVNKTFPTIGKAGDAQAQAEALGKSGWATGHYTATGTPGGSLINAMKTLSSVPSASFTPKLHTVTTYLQTLPKSGTKSVAGLAATVKGNTRTAVESYLKSLAPKTTGAGTAGTVTAANRSFAQSGAAGGGSAQIATVLKKAGLTSLIPWATNQATTLAGQGMSPSTIATQISLDLQTTPQFKARFPGMTLRKNNGYDAVSIAEYLTYETSAKQMGRAAGLPTGFMTNTEIGQLIGHDVSSSELSARLTKAYQVANTAPQETKDLLTSYFGIKTGGAMAAYFLTPNKALPLLENQVTAAQIGTAGVTSGFGTVGGTQAMYLTKMGVNQATATDTFKSLSKLAPLMGPLAGTGGEKTSLSETDLVNYGFFGANPQEVSQVEQTRKAPFEGGGGYAESAKGVVGAAFGTSQGTTNT